MADKYIGYEALGNLSGHRRKEKSHLRLIIHQVKRETFASWGYTRSSKFSDGILIVGFTNLERKQVFQQELQCMESLR